MTQLKCVKIHERHEFHVTDRKFQMLFSRSSYMCEGHSVKLDTLIVLCMHSLPSTVNITDMFCLTLVTRSN